MPRSACLIPLALVFFQLSRFQILPTADRQALDEAPYPLNQHIETPRGRIMDRNGSLLAGNSSRYRVYVDSCQYYLYMEQHGGLAEGGDPSLSDVIAAVARASGAEINTGETVSMLQEVDKALQAEYNQPLSTCTLMAGVRTDSAGQELAIPLWLTEEQNNGLEVAQGIRPDAAGKYHNGSDLLFNIRTEAWFFRNYPEGNLASEIIGYSRQEGSGQGRSEEGVIRFYREIGDWGVERFYNDILQGAREDVSWTVVPVEITSNLDRAQPPADLVLTIDREIQAETEAALREGVLRGRSDARVDHRPEPAHRRDPRHGRLPVRRSAGSGWFSGYIQSQGAPADGSGRAGGLAERRRTVRARIDLQGAHHGGGAGFRRGDAGHLVHGFRPDRDRRGGDPQLAATAGSACRI